MRLGPIVGVVMIACGHGAPRPAASSGPAPGSAIDASAPADAEQAEPGASLPNGCHPVGDGANIFPPVDENAPALVTVHDGKRTRTGGFELCDLPDRIVVVDSTAKATKDPTVTRLSGVVIDVPRGAGATVRAPIAAGSTCLDRCNAPEGGKAGCSIDAGCTIESAAPGARVIHLSLDSRDAGDGHTQVGCGPGHRDFVGLCATRERLVLLETVPCRPGGSDEAPFLVKLAVYDQGAPRTDGDADAPPSFELNGNYYAEDTTVAAPGDRVWAYRFPDDGGRGDYVLRFTVGATPSAALTVAGKTSECVASSFTPRAM